MSELLTSEWDTDAYGTWLNVDGMRNIKNALLRLRNANLIVESFYIKVAKNFPKAGGGFMDLTTENPQINPYPSFAEFLSYSYFNNNVQPQCSTNHNPSIDSDAAPTISSLLPALVSSQQLSRGTSLPITNIDMAVSSFLSDSPRSLSITISLPDNTPVESSRLLNGGQENIIDATFVFIFDTIFELNPVDAIKALKAMLRKNISLDEIAEFKKLEVWECIEQVKTILSHPCPQNRSESFPYVEPEVGFAMFKMYKYSETKKGDSKTRTMTARTDKEGNIILKNGRVIARNHIIRNREQDDHFIAKEETGLLGLTGREDNTTPPVTKQAVVQYINQLINNAIEKQSKLIQQSENNLSQNSEDDCEFPQEEPIQRFSI